MALPAWEGEKALDAAHCGIRGCLPPLHGVCCCDEATQLADVVYSCASERPSELSRFEPLGTGSHNTYRLYRLHGPNMHVSTAVECMSLIECDFTEVHITLRAPVGCNTLNGCQSGLDPLRSAHCRHCSVPKGGMMNGHAVPTGCGANECECCWLLRA